MVAMSKFESFLKKNKDFVKEVSIRGVLADEYELKYGIGWEEDSQIREDFEKEYNRVLSMEE